ncbi:MAG: amino acid adenylation domain-containing protein [Acidobacteriota bacterium]
MTELQERISSLSPEKRALLARRMAQSAAPKERQAAIGHQPDGPIYPSFGQQTMWASDQTEYRTAQYNEGLRLEFRGELNIAALSQALNDLVERHVPLRTRFIKTEDGRLDIELTTGHEIQMPVRDLSAMDEGLREAALRAEMRAEANLPIPLDCTPLLRTRLYTLNAQHHVLQLTIHHAATDGWSVGLCLRDLAAFYNAAVSGVPAELPQLPITFFDYARWERELIASAEGKRLFSYWENQLKGTSFALNLPTDRPRNNEPTLRGSVRRFALSKVETTVLSTFCLREKVTPFMVTLAAFYAVLGRYTGQTDFVVGSQIASRSLIETEDLVGYMTNGILLRSSLDGDPTFRELLERVKKTALDAYAHQNLPLDLVVSRINPPRDPSRPALLPVMLIFQNAPAHRMEMSGLETSVEEVRSDTSKLDFMVELSISGGVLNGVIEYSTALFDAATMDRLWGHIVTYLSNAMEAPETKSAAIPMLPAGELNLLVEGWNATESAYPRETPLATLIEAQVERTPNAIAVADEKLQFTYKELNERANQLAHQLRAHGAGPNQLIGVCLDRSTDLVVTLLAIVKTGAAYVPLDPLLPGDRLRYMLQDSGLRLLISERSLSARLPLIAGTMLMLEDSGWLTNSRDNLAIEVMPEDLAYVIYTSGSTGKPKGVQIPRGALTNFLFSTRDLLQLSERDRLLAVTTISFDIAGLEIWLPLLAGAQVVLASRETAIDGAALLRLFERFDITCMQATPVTWRLLLEAGWRGKVGFQAVCGGEAMPPELARQLLPAAKRLWNMYGPTETTIWSTAHEVKNGTEPILIGRPLANTQCYILDEQMQPVPVGVTGELFIGGDGLAVGYLNRPELTAEKFVADPFRGEAARMYRTGDLARYRADGNIECLGRIDHQIKLRGYRVELGEIEAALKELPGVAQAVVVAHEDAAGDKRLAGYLIASGKPLQAPELRARLRLSLPNYMVPSTFRYMEQFPLTPNGKIDRKQLTPVEVAKSVPTEDCGRALTPIEETLAKIWAEVVDVPQVGIHDDFFEIGGNSLLAVRLLTRIRAEFPESRPTLPEILQFPSVEKFAHTLASVPANRSCLVTIRGGQQRPPFFVVPGAGGNVLSVKDLAEALPVDLPFCCLEARGLDGHSAPFTSVEDSAEYYVSLIRKVQPKGPYHLGGGCYGGLVAFEIARRLRALGETVGLLALIDTENSAYGQLISKKRLLALSMSFLVRRTLHHTKALPRVEPRNLRRYVHGRLVVLQGLTGKFARIAARKHTPPVSKGLQEQMPESAEPSNELSEAVARVRDASYLAAERYVPKAYDGHVIVFKAKMRLDDPYRDEALGWRPLALGGVTTHEIEGDHISIFAHPDVRAIAEKLDAAVPKATPSYGNR